MIDIKKIHPCIPYFNSLSKLADKKIINLTSNGQNCLPNEKIKDIAIAALTLGHSGISDLDGHIGLREKIACFFEKEYSWKYNPATEITITAGAPQAISTIISAFIKEGDEALIIEPSFFSYGQIVDANGGRPVYIQMKQPDFHIDWDEVQKGINGHTKLIIINSPNNPTGKTLNASDIERLAKIVNGTKILILSDESFLNILFDKFEHQSITRYPQLAERSFIVSSLGKWFSTDGWKIGFCAAPTKLTADFRRFHNVISYSVNSPFQVAFDLLLKDPSNYQSVASILQEKRDLLISGLKKSKFSIVPSQGSYFLLLNFSKISNSKDIDFVRYLLDEKNIATVPLSYFYHDLADQKYIRICFAQPNETLIQAIELLQNI
jgi:methionine aminotransferase